MTKNNRNISDSTDWHDISSTDLPMYSDASEYFSLPIDYISTTRYSLRDLMRMANEFNDQAEFIYGEENFIYTLFAVDGVRQFIEWIKQGEENDV